MSLLLALLLTAGANTRGDPGILVRSMPGSIVWQPSDDPAATPFLACPFTTPGDYASGNTTLCTRDDQTGAAMTVIRASSATYIDANGLVTTAAADRVRVESGGMLSEAGATNVALNSAAINLWDLDTVTAYANDATCPVAPDGTQTMDLLVSGGGSNHFAYQTFDWTGQGVTDLTFDAWIAATTATAIGSVAIISYGAAMSTCECYRPDGGTCAAALNVNICSAYATVGTTPVRMQVHATAPGPDYWSPILAPGIPSVDVGTSICAWGAQAIKSQNYLTTMSYIPTTGTAAAREYDVAFVQLVNGGGGKTLDPHCWSANVQTSLTGRSAYPSGYFLYDAVTPGWIFGGTSWGGSPPDGQTQTFSICFPVPCTGSFGSYWYPDWVSPSRTKRAVRYGVYGTSIPPNGEHVFETWMDGAQSSISGVETSWVQWPRGFDYIGFNAGILGGSWLMGDDVTYFQNVKLYEQRCDSPKVRP